MQFSLQGAATPTGKAKSTIQRAIKSGKLSATRNDDGSYSIDSSELYLRKRLDNAEAERRQLLQVLRDFTGVEGRMGCLDEMIL